MKRLLVFIFAVIMVSAFAACGSGEPPSNSAAGEEVTEAAAVYSGSDEETKEAEEQDISLSSPAIEQGNKEVASSGYRTFYIEEISSLSDAIEGFSMQNVLAGNDSSLMLDQSWRIKTVGYIHTINKCSESILAYDEDTVPQEWSEFHMYMRAAAVYFQLMTQTYVEGIDEMDAKKILQATEYMNTAETNVDLANSAMPSL
jgi:hypothetical protein